MSQISTVVLSCGGEQRVVNKFYQVNRDFLEAFDIPLLQGDKNDVLQREGQAIISESFARKLFGEVNFDEFQMPVISIKGRKYDNDTVLVSGIFKDIPETSHFHTDILLHLPDDKWWWSYTYLLLKKETDINALAQKMTEIIEKEGIFQPLKTRVLLMPLTDIHLHSRNLREMEINGNIHYIYLVIGANLLLLTVVLFNLWLNASLIFSHNRRFYQLTRLHGAPLSAVFKDETLLALILGICSIIAGGAAVFYLLSLGKMHVQLTLIELSILSAAFLLLIIAVSLLPALKNISTTLFLNMSSDMRPARFSYANVRYMFTIQYAIVMITVILAFGINKQMNLVKNTQVGGNERNILVTTEQPYQVTTRYALLKSELLKHTEIEDFTTSFQLPGDAIRDGIHAKKENDADWQILPMMVAGEDFLPFFRIGLIAGRGFSPAKYDSKTEEEIFWNFLNHQKQSEHIEEYIINRKALTMFGFSAPEEAVGEMLQIKHGTIDYFRGGIIVGVTDDFNYTGLYEESIPMLIMQRHAFQHCIMVRLAPDRIQQARAVFEKVWNEVNPEYPADYKFMSDVFGRMYHNEINAQQLVFIFSLLCLTVADLGLIVFMAFIIRRRTKEIGIRKVHGASVAEIIRMLNMDFVRYVALAFVIAVPVGWYVMHRWLERFAYRTAIEWWVFPLAGASVLVVLVVSVSVQSWRAATKNPVDAIKEL
jgi:putative ABC transport system permease protein